MEERKVETVGPLYMKFRGWREHRNCWEFSDGGKG